MNTFTNCENSSSRPLQEACFGSPIFACDCTFKLFRKPPVILESVPIRVSTEVTFCHSAEYGSDFRRNSGEIPRNSAEFRGISPELSRNLFRSQKIPRNSVSAEFRGHPSSDAGYECTVHCMEKIDQ
jgi:hypothetical protein